MTRYHPLSLLLVLASAACSDDTAVAPPGASIAEGEEPVRFGWPVSADAQDEFLQSVVDRLPMGWQHLRTTHFLFMYDGDVAAVERLAEHGERFMERQALVPPGSDRVTPVILVMAMKDRDTYLGYGSPAGTVGHFSPHYREIVLSMDGKPRDLRATFLKLAREWLDALEPPPDVTPPSDGDD